jgi:hypothetical protein
MPTSISTRLKWIPGGASSQGVSSQVYERLEQNELSAWEKARTGQIVPSTECGLENERPVDIQEVFTMFGREQDIVIGGEEEEESGNADGEHGDGQAELDSATVPIQEISSSGMFALDDRPDIVDEEKVPYVCVALLRCSRPT